MHTVDVLKISNTSFLPKRPRQTVQTLIRLLLQTVSEEADQSGSLLFADPIV